MCGVPFTDARAIWTRITNEPNQYAAFQTVFSLESKPENLSLYIRADNRYAVWINGQYIPAQQYSDYDFYRVYDKLNLPAALLREGDNLMSVLGYCQNEDSSIYRKGCPSLIFELRNGEQVLTASGPDTLCSEATGYTSGAVEKVSRQLSYSFRYDAEIAGNWTDCFCAGSSGWKPAHVLSHDHQDFHPRPIHQLIVNDPAPAKIVAQGAFQKNESETSGERISGAWLKHFPFQKIALGERALPSKDGIVFSIHEGNGCYIIVDLLHQQAGYVSLDFKVDTPCDLDMGWGEHLEDLRVRAEIDGRNFAFSYHAKAGRNRFMVPIKRLGCRYLQLHMGAQNFKLFYAGILPVEYPLKALPVPEGLNPLQTRIYDVSVHTLKCCIHEHYEDTPWREQALYAMDSRNQMLFNYAAFGETEYAKANLRLLGLGQNEDGLLELCAPARVNCNIPCFSLVWISALWEYYLQSKDTAFLMEMQSTLERILTFFKRYIRDGLLYNPPGYWHFYEWAPFLDGTTGSHYDDYTENEGYDAPLNAFYSMALQAAESILIEIGLQNEAHALSLINTELKLKYHDAFWSPHQQAYRISTVSECKDIYPQLVQALTICASLCVDEAEEKAMISRLLTDEFWPKVTLSHSIYLYEAALRDSMQRNAVLNDMEQRWSAMLYQGATTFWETEQGAEDFNGAGSLCHGWSAVPIWVYHRLFGA